MGPGQGNRTWNVVAFGGGLLGAVLMASTSLGARRAWGGGVLDEFAACWDELDDPRTGNAGLHDFHELLFIALCSVLCGGQGAVDMALFAKSKEPFLRRVLTLANGAPSHDTFSRLFRQLDPEAFRTAFGRFMAGFSEQCRGMAPVAASGAVAAGVVAIDGKILRRSVDRASGTSALHMVSAWGCEQRLVLAQVSTDAKSNEITAVPALLRLLSLQGTVVTADALHCQSATARQIVDQGGDYALALKGNQGTLHDDVVRFLDDPATKAATAKPAVDAGHGRVERRRSPGIETRTATVSADIGWFAGAARLARPHGHRQGASHPRNRGRDDGRDRLLPAQRRTTPRAPERGRPVALGDREPTALAARCRHERRPGPHPTGTRPREPGRPATHGPERHPSRTQQGIPARQTQTGRMG